MCRREHDAPPDAGPAAAGAGHPWAASRPTSGGILTAVAPPTSQPDPPPAPQTPSSPAAPLDAGTRRLLIVELVLVLGLSLGRSAVYAVLELAERLSRGPLGEQTATVQTSQSRLEIFDATYQVLDSVFALVPAALALFLLHLHRAGDPSDPFRRIGLDLRRPGRDVAVGLGLFGFIGAGTLLVYLVGRSLGITAELVPADVTAHWWTPAVLLLAALRHGLVEEIIMVGWFLDRCRRLAPRTAPWVLVLISAVIRGAYHLYQGIGPGLGNLLMGLIFGALYLRTGRVMPLVIAHALLDAVAFLAFPLVLRLTGVGALLGG